MLFISHLSSLLWKNWVLSRRSKGWLIVKGLIASLFAGFFLYSIVLYQQISADVPDELKVLLGYFLFTNVSTAALILMKEVAARIMLEKTLKIREHFRIQGLNEASYSLSYLVYYAVIVLGWLVLPVVPILLIYGSPALESFAFFFLCMLSSLSSVYALCAFFDDARIAAFCVYVSWILPAAPIIAYFSLFFLGISVEGFVHDVIRHSASVLHCLHPASTVASVFSPFSDYSPLENCLTFLAQIALYLTFGGYFHLVVKSKHGSSRPWNFFLSDPAPTQPVPTSLPAVDPSRFEPVDTIRPAGVVAENVVKEFDDGSVVAVNGLSLTVYKGEIFALIGHNGAGKTTFLDCIVGSQTITHGRIILNGFDVATDPDAARRHIGVCPQFDAFYPNFTTMEMLVLYGRLNGDTSARAHSNALDLLQRFELLRSMNVMADTLSGGQKRKLSVGLAFTGTTQTVILDEPSSGMDTESALQLWTIIRNLRRSRTIILTTHNMNEAESLGDRIGIMSAGSMQCLGSSLFLKSRLGSGYAVSIVLEVVPSDGVAGSSVNRARLCNFIQSIVPRAQIHPFESAQELTLQVRNDDLPLLAQLLSRIETDKRDLNILDYAVTPSQLEDVFINISKEHEWKLHQGLEPLKALPFFTPVPVSPCSHIVSLGVLFWRFFISDIEYFLSLILPLVLVIISFSTDFNFFKYSVMLLFLNTASTLCSNISHFVKSDIRLQLDIFGMSSVIYHYSINCWNLIQFAIPFWAISVCWLLSSHDVDEFAGSTVAYISPATISPFVFAVVGFMTFIRSVPASINGGYAIVVPFFLALTLRFPFLSSSIHWCIPALFNLHPVCLFHLRQFKHGAIEDWLAMQLFIGLGILYFTAAILLDIYHLHPNLFTRSRNFNSSSVFERARDNDVAAEARRVLSGVTDVLQVVDLAKAYKQTVAVRGITVGVPGGQSLAFLGVNGSGKSSSIRCILGLSAPSLGFAQVGGVNVTEDEFAARQNIGYVPQHDNILIGRMSARQQLNFFARLAGIPGSICSELIGNLLFNVGLHRAADRRCDTYSGGMKRKLCVALALMLRRQVVVMDEPTTGVDPASRRRFWSIFAEIQSDPDRCLLLTTHQLEEAEAVCDRISIMVKGELVCLGSASHLKRKFGNHYQVDLNASDVSVVGQVRDWFMNQYQRASLIESDGVHLRFWVPKSTVSSLADLFTFVHLDRSGIPLRDASVGGTSLEQIFLMMAVQSKQDAATYSVQIPARSC